MKRSLFVACLSLIMNGCQREPTIELIVPNGFSGLFRIVHNPDEGVAAIVRDGTYIYNIPDDGSLLVNNIKVFTQWHNYRVKYSTGELIPNAMDQENNRNCFSGLWTTAADRARGVTMWYYIGPREEADKLASSGKTETEEEFEKRLQKRREVESRPGS